MITQKELYQLQRLSRQINEAYAAGRGSRKLDEVAAEVDLFRQINARTAIRAGKAKQ